MDDDAAAPDGDELPTGRSEEREERQHAMQQHGDTFAVGDEDEADEQSEPKRVSALPGNEPEDGGH
jgi:hypothetical protein